MNYQDDEEQEEISLTTLEDKDDLVHLFSLPKSWDYNEMQEFSDILKNRDIFDFSSCIIISGKLGSDDDDIEIISATEEELMEKIDV